MKAERDQVATLSRAVQKPRVLIVEDNHIIAVDLQEILKGCGCEIIGLEVSVAGALNALESTDIDLAIVDFILEGRSLHGLAD